MNGAVKYGLGDNVCILETSGEDSSCYLGLDATDMTWTEGGWCS